MHSVLVRAARPEDLAALAALETQTWSTAGSPPLSEQDFLAWYEEGSPLFLVSEHEGSICGYYFGRCVRFSFDQVDEFIRASIIRDGTWLSTGKHDPEGRVSYGISTISSVKGAGSLMSARAREIWREQKLTHSIGFTRLSGLNEYLHDLELANGGNLPYDRDLIALWYAHANAHMLGLRSWDACTPKPKLSLPVPPRPDPVLAFHARGNPIGLLRVVPNYMPDVASRNYAAFIALETADIP